MLYVFIGEDDFSVRQYLEEIRRGMGDRTALATNTATLDGEHLGVGELRAATETVPFLADKRLVIVEGLLERFEPRSRSAPKGARRPDQKDEVKALAAGIVGTPEFTTLVLLGGRIGNRNPLLTELVGKAQVKTFSLLRGTELQRWVERRVAEAGGAISAPAVEILTRLVGSNLWVMASEIEKLVLFAAGRRIEEKDVRAIVGYIQEANVFTMVDAILASRADLAGPLLQRLLEWGATPTYLLAMLSRQAQMIVRAKELAENRKPRAEIQARLGLPEFALRRTLEQANRYSLPRLRELYHRLLEADLSIKTGRYDGDLALDILVAELCAARQG